MPHTSAHPSWCENQQPAKDAHIHTSAIGSIRLGLGVTADIVLVQAPDAANALLALHITAPDSSVSVDITGAQAWALAGMLIDGTVAHARAAPESAQSTTREPSGSRPERPVWLLDRQIRHRPTRAPWTGSRCLPESGADGTSGAASS